MKQERYDELRNPKRGTGYKAMTHQQILDMLNTDLGLDNIKSVSVEITETPTGKPITRKQRKSYIEDVATY